MTCRNVCLMALVTASGALAKKIRHVGDPGFNRLYDLRTFLQSIFIAEKTNTAALI
jgi:hypothetical protein